MTATATPVILALLCAGAATADPGWPVGWGFEAHGGFPPLPPAWQTYSLQKSTVGFFLGNATGMDSAEEVRAEVRLGIVGVGWQINNIPSYHSNLEVFELEEARRLKTADPTVKVNGPRSCEGQSSRCRITESQASEPSSPIGIPSSSPEPRTTGRRSNKS